LKELSEGFVSGKASKSPSPNNGTQFLSNLDANTPQSAVYQDTSRTNLDQQPKEEPGYYLSMGEMITQHQLSQVEEPYNDDATNIIVPNSRLSNLSGERQHKSVSSKRGCALRRGLPMSQKTTVRKEPT
jgi:hypothetical protein